jgi:predicted DNA-binding WGR domain protein
VTDHRRFSRYAEKKAGTQNKFYEVRVEEIEENGRARLLFVYGRIGTEGRVIDKGLCSNYDYAVRLANEQFRKKTAKGYREVTAMEALASAVETLEERKTNGLPAVELDIPRFHAGTSEKRCQQMCEKWLDKLNIVRRSRWDLGEAYEKQIEGVLKGFCKEWVRVTQTKAHGHLSDNATAHSAFKIFFNALKDNASCFVYGYFPGVGSSY